MKTTRRIFAMLLALAMVLSLCGVAFAQVEDNENAETPAPPLSDEDEPESTPFKIFIDNAVQGETYTAYKIFDVTFANVNASAETPAPATDIPGAPDPNHHHTAYAYSILDTSPWWSVVTNGATAANYTVGQSFTANGLTFTKSTVANQWIVEATNSFDPAAFATLLNDNKGGKPVAATATATTVTDPTAHPATDTYYTTGAIRLDVGAPGYYFVDTTTGSLCSLDTTEPTATIREKNSLPTQVKKVSDTEDGTYGDSTTASIGDTVYFKIDVTDGIGTDAALTVHDVMSAGLTLCNASGFTVQVDNADVPTGSYTIMIAGTADVTMADDDCTFEIVFDADYIASLADGKVITIKYTAVVNDGAVIAGAGNPNTSKVEYSHQMTPESTPVVYTYAGALYKFNASGAELSGASFTMVDSNNITQNTNLNHQMYFIQIDAGSDTTPAVYRYNSQYTASTTIGEAPDPVLTATDTITTPLSGAIVIYGLDIGTYTLTETAAPTGYNLLDHTVTLTVAATSAALSEDVPFTTSSNATATFVHAADDTNGGIVYQLAKSSVLGVENLTGSELPSTGGIGTTIFIIAGSILVLGAGIILVAMSVSKRRSEEN